MSGGTEEKRVSTVGLCAETGTRDPRTLPKNISAATFTDAESTVHVTYG